MARIENGRLSLVHSGSDIFPLAWVERYFIAFFVFVAGEILAWLAYFKVDMRAMKYRWARADAERERWVAEIEALEAAVAAEEEWTDDEREHEAEDK